MKNTRKHWYVVGHRSGARVFEQVGIKPDLTLLRTFDNPEGLKKVHELVSDRQGRSDYQGADGHIPVGRESGPRAHVLERFARQVGDYLETEAIRDSFESLVFVAGPDMLGEFKKVLGRGATLKLRNSFVKDLVHISDGEMEARLKDILCVREDV